jgi:anaerobic magnesium-protoporphyrin IX monomethyl ester cyclase
MCIRDSNSGRFAATLQVLAAGAPLSRRFADLARHCEQGDQGASLSLGQLFESLWGFAQATCSAEERERLKDALSFDYCRTGYPGGVRPGFLTLDGDVEEKEMPEGVRPAQRNERVRYYRRRFAWDYRSVPSVRGPVQLTFIYRSAPGKGLQVEVR